MTGDDVVRAACAWLGTPHVNGAKIKGIGVDCGQLLIGVAEDCGAIRRGEVVTAPYSNAWHLHRSTPFFEELVKTYCDPVDGLPEPGDYLVYQYGRCVSHGGIYMGNDMVLHAYIDQGVVLSAYHDVMFYDARGRFRLRGVYRLKGMSK